MANIIIGYKNLCVPGGPIGTTRFFPPSEHADHDADNLGKAHPAEFWRMTTLSPVPSYLRVDPPDPGLFNLIAPLYTTAAAHRNVALRSSDMKAYSAGTVDEGWTKKDISFGPSVSGGGVFTGTKVPKIGFSSNTSNTTHELSRSHVISTKQTDFKYSLYFETHATANAYVRVDFGGVGSANYGYAEVDLSDGSINASGVGGTVSTATASTETIASGEYRITLHVASANTVGDITLTVGILDGSFNRTHATFYTIECGGVLLYETSDTAAETGAAILTTDDGAGYWGFSVEDALPLQLDGTLYSMSSSYDSLAEKRDWVHCQHYHSPSLLAFNSSNEIGIYFVCGNNKTTFNGATPALDISNIYIGPSWQPTQNLLAYNIDTLARQAQAGVSYSGAEYVANLNSPRQWTIDLGFQTRDDAFSEAHAMGIRNGQHDPILVILDPDETEYGQEMMLYGRLLNLSIGADRWFADRGDGTAGVRPAVSFTIRELLPG